MAVSPGRVRRVCAKRRQGRRSEIEAEARKSGSVVASVSVGGATAYVASGEIEVPPSARMSRKAEYWEIHDFAEIWMSHNKVKEK